VLGNGAAGVSVDGGNTTTVGGPAVVLANLITDNHRGGVDVAGSNKTSINRNGFIVNGGSGVRVTTSTNTTIGGSSLGVLNSISGSVDAVALVGSGVQATTVAGNVLGSVSGTTPTANSGNGIYITNASVTRVGGTLPIERNVISFNAGHGVLATGSGATGLVLVGNFIGTDSAGTVAKRNGVDGVFLQAPGAVVGGTGVGARNVISGNTHGGIVASGAGATGATIVGNTIGLGSDGLAFLGNGDDGVAVSGAPGIVIGGANPGEGNVISGNGSDGVQIAGHAATANVVKGNFLGTDLVGESDRGNNAAGVRIADAPGNVVGGQQAGEGNTIAGNNDDGVDLTGAAATGNTIQGNLIGVAIESGVLTALANSSEGVLVDAPGNTIGGPAGLGGNIIGGNLDNGLVISETGNVVAGNFVGTDGIHVLGNGNHGILALTAVTIGGNATSANVISGNTKNGIEIDADDVVVAGNLIGTNAAATAAIANGTNGIAVGSGTGVLIGGDQPEDRNVIGGNTLDGVAVSGATANGTRVEGNVIGRSGPVGTGNHGNGVELEDVSDVTIGGVKSETGNPGNVIASNVGDGVLVSSGTKNTIEGNSIVGNGEQGIDLGPDDGVTANDFKDPDTGANKLQNFPIFTKAVVGGGFLTAAGNLNSRPNTVYTLELYTSTACDASGNGEGQTPVGTVTLPATGTDGNAKIAIDIPASFAVGVQLTAVAISPSGDTSEFSPCQSVAEATADLAVGLTDAPDPVAHGQNLTYTASVTNLGPDVAHAITLTQTLGPKLVFVSASTPIGSCDHTGNRVTCDLGAFKSGGSTTITIVATTTVAATITNSATVAGSATDPVSSNNVATASTVVT
jgi:uncharacterized repeat protein (TIGR01451 family)